MNKKTAVIAGLATAGIAAGVATLTTLAVKNKPKTGTVTGSYYIDFDSVTLEDDKYSISLDGHKLSIEKEIVEQLEIAELFEITYELKALEGFDGEVISIEKN